MTLDIRTVGPRIRMLLPELTPSEMRVTEIMFRSAADDSLPLKHVAAEAEISEAMVVKTAKRLGFVGFRALRSALSAYKQLPNVASWLVHAYPSVFVRFHPVANNRLLIEKLSFL